MPPTIIQRQKEYTPLSVSLSGKRLGQPVMLAMTVAAVGTGSMYSAGNTTANAAEAPGTLDRSNYQQFATLGDHLETGTVLEATTDDGDDQGNADREGFTEYTVQQGDELKSIAASFGLRTSTLVWANDLANPDLIYPGDVLAIPPTDGASVVVQEGDTLRDIATQYGVSVTSIINYEPNQITDPDLITVGQTLIVPGGMPPAPADSGSSSGTAESSGTSESGDTAEFQAESETSTAEAAPAAEPEPEPEPAPEGIYVEVQAGDTILAIADRYSVSSQAIIDWGPNGLTNPDALAIGQELFIPGGVEPVVEEAQYQDEGEAQVVEQESEPAVEAEVDEQESESEVETEVVEQEPEQAPANDAGVANGNFVWPTEGVITQRFGHTSFSQSSGWYGSTGHPGLDIANSTNTAINAADGGTVIVSGWSGGYGYAVAIDHGNGYVTWYGHMAQQPPVSVGQSVSQGEYIGPMGSTGYSTGSHLHFEIRKNGNYQDPLSYL